ncbi:MAG: cellulose synthase operon protein YhjQ/BcsQ [Anaerolineales bacterium]|jgi:CO dehydrogenase maturation factor
MTKTIAFAGKGGTGKTTIAALLTNNLVQSVSGPLLAIDADPSTNLHLALGLPMPATVGDIREDMADSGPGSQLGVGISRLDYLRREIQMVLEEGEKIDLLAMGRPEGQGCYCAANHLLRSIIDELAGNYQLLVIDNEAGMEHISRRTTRDVDVLFIITDPTLRGMKAAESILEMSRDLEINIHKRLLILNRVAGDLPQPLQEAIDQLDVEVGAVIPADPKINELDALGKPLINLNGESPAQREISKLADRLLELI